MEGIGGIDLSTLRVSIGTIADSANFRVQNRDVLIREGTVTSGNPVAIDIPSNLLVEDSSYQNRWKGIRVSTPTDGATIFVLAETIFSGLNYGVFLAYPCLSFENTATYEYYVISTMASDSLRSLVLLVGCEDDTAITITPTQSITLPQDVQMDGSALTTLTPGSSHAMFLSIKCKRYY